MSVRVIRDVNANSVYDPALEVGVANIPVTLTDDAGTELLASTDANGVVTFDPATATTTLIGGRYRVEARIPPGMPYLQPAQVAGGDLSPLTDFVDVRAGANASLVMGVINPADYVGPDPGLVTAYQWPSAPPEPPLLADPRSLISFDYDDRGVAPTPTPATEAQQTDTNNVYGLAYQRTTGAVFSGAYAKRSTAYGTSGSGAVYRTDTATDTTTEWGVVPNAGTTPHGTVGLGDLAFWDVVGKEGLGDLDLSEDGSRLFVVNLNDRSLYEYDANAPTMGTPLSVTPIPDPQCADPDDWRPFGLGVRDNVLYVGGVCTGESSGLRSDVSAAVWTFDVTGALGAPQLALEQPLDFLRGGVSGAGTTNPDVNSHWNAWLPTYSVTIADYDITGLGGPGRHIRRPMPMLSDIAVEADGSLVLGFRDRLGDQLGANEVADIPNTLDLVMSGGDLNRACRNADGTYSWEGDNGCPDNAVGDPPGGTGGPSQLAAVEEYYPGEYFGLGAHEETAQGAIALALSEQRLASTTMDPVARVTAGGVGFYDRTNGSMWAPGGVNAYELFADGRFNAGSTQYSFGKGNGLADLEIIAALAPIEIGNYVWFDADRDGVQDPSEAPVAGVTVELLDAAGGVVGTTTTDASGNYYFGGSGNVGMVNAQPLLPDTSYVVRVPNAVGGSQQAPLAGWVLTLQDSGAATDTTDSDGALAGDHAQVAIVTGGPGFNNHTYDFGFYLPVYDLALRKTLAAGQPAVVNPGDLVTFTITVFNQGLNAASNATVVDYIPAGMTLEDPDWTAGAGNTATTVLPGTIAPGASATVDISLRLSAEPFEGAKDNYAEIASFTDEWGGTREDEDSTPDDEFGNDSRVDDEVNNSGGDEDDEDIASITVTTPPPPTTTTVAPTTPPQPPPPPTTGIPTPGELPATGGNSGGLVVAAFILLLGGGVVLAFARLRRRPTQ